MNQHQCFNLIQAKLAEVKVDLDLVLAQLPKISILTRLYEHDYISILTRLYEVVHK